MKKTSDPVTKVSDKHVCFPYKDFYGSRFRCLLLTHLPKHDFYDLIRKVCQNPRLNISFDDELDSFLPKGFCAPQEPYLTNIKDPVISSVLSKDVQQNLLTWWLAEKPLPSTRTPVWDIVSTCTINNKRGLLIVEAKAHSAENSPSPKELRPSTNIPNHKNIKKRMDEACVALSDLTGLPWGLDRDRYYQLGNRFTWSWKLAQLGIPVVLLYLGFTKAKDMELKGKSIFHDYTDFTTDFMKDEVSDIVPIGAWENDWYVKNGSSNQSTEFLPLLRTVYVDTITYQNPRS